MVTSFRMRNHNRTTADPSKNPGDECVLAEPDPRVNSMFNTKRKVVGVSFRVDGVCFILSSFSGTPSGGHYSASCFVYLWRPSSSEEQCVRLSARYPVILSIENHCNVPQQKKMAHYLTEIFGDKLDVSSIKADVSGRLPSPEALKGRILVKVPSETHLAAN